MGKVLHIAKDVNANLEMSDNSEGHRLLSLPSSGKKPVIVRFACRNGKINSLRSSKSLQKSHDIEAYGDLTLPELQLFNLMSNDERLKKVWTCESMINFMFKGKSKLNRIDNAFASISFNILRIETTAAFWFRKNNQSTKCFTYVRRSSLCKRSIENEDDCLDFLCMINSMRSTRDHFRSFRTF